MVFDESLLDMVTAEGAGNPHGKTRSQRRDVRLFHFPFPGQIGLAGFNGVELLEGLPRQLATMDACRAEIGEKAAEIILERSALPENAEPPPPQHITLAPKIAFGDTLRRRG